jgi:hypothetical protein
LQEEQKAKLKDFKRITSDSVPGQQAAALEYTFTDKKMGPLHGLDRVIVTPTGTSSSSGARSPRSGRSTCPIWAS